MKQLNDTIDAEQTKRCPCCKETKTFDQFHVMHSRGGKPTVYCKPCTAIKNRNVSSRWSQVQGQAKYRKIDWQIEKGFFFELVKMRCHYCAGPLAETGTAMDRINHELAYSPSNVVPACPLCNWIRQDVFSFEEMKELGALISKIRKDRGMRGDQPLLNPHQKVQHAKVKSWK